MVSNDAWHTWVSDTTTCRLWFAFLESEWYLCTPSGLPLNDRWVPYRSSAQLCTTPVILYCSWLCIYICSCMYILFSDQPHISVPGPVSNEIVVVAFAGLTRFLPYGPVCAPRWSKISYRRCMSEFGVRWKSECSSYVVYICFISGLYVGYIYIYMLLTGYIMSLIPVIWHVSNPCQRNSDNQRLGWP